MTIPRHKIIWARRRMQQEPLLVFLLALLSRSAGASVPGPNTVNITVGFLAEAENNQNHLLAKAAAASLNADPTIVPNGFAVVLKSYFDQGNTDLAFTGVGKFVTAGAAAVIGPLTSGLTRALLPFVYMSRLPLVSYGATDLSVQR